MKKQLDKPTRTVPEYPNYRITQDGDVYSEFSGRLLKHKVSFDGYSRVGLTLQKGKQTWVMVHRLVAYAWLDRPEGCTEVNHKDGNKSNNSTENLEWCTSSENQLHSLRMGLRKTKSRFTADDLDLMVWLHHQGNSQEEIAKLFRCSKAWVAKVTQGRHLKTKSGRNPWQKTTE